MWWLNVLETVRTCLQNVDGTFPKRSGNILKTFWKGIRTCLQNVDGIFPKCSGNVLKCFRKVMLMF